MRNAIKIRALVVCPGVLSQRCTATIETVIEIRPPPWCYNGTGDTGEVQIDTVPGPIRIFEIDETAIERGPEYATGWEMVHHVWICPACLAKWRNT